MKRIGLTDQLRDRIVGALHLGNLRAGDRLPSIRHVAAESGADARAVARAYRALEAEGLLEIRSRSGIYAAPQARVGGVLLEETAQWAARVLVEGWRRGIALAEVPQFLRRCCTARRARCAFVESCEDVIAAFTFELRDQIGLEVMSVRLPSLAPGDPPPTSLAGADLLVTTVFHSREVRPLAEALGRPLIVATVNGEMVSAVERRLRAGPLTLICADAEFGQRMATQYREVMGSDSRLRVILADDRRTIAGLERSVPVLLTRAARERLGRVGLPLIHPHSPTISAASAMELAEFLIRFNLGGGSRSA
jgi:DNA-binding transcriptional regulator YhcF (GntR family)